MFISQTIVQIFMENKESMVELLLAIIAILATFVMPLPLTESSRLAATGAVLIFYLTISLFRFNRRLNDFTLEQKRLDEKLKIHEQLINIKKDIEILKERYKK